MTLGQLRRYLAEHTDHLDDDARVDIHVPIANSIASEGYPADAVELLEIETDTGPEQCLVITTEPVNRDT